MWKHKKTAYEETQKESLRSTKTHQNASDLGQNILRKIKIDDPWTRRRSRSIELKT